MKQITDRQREIREYIEQYIKHHGYSPTQKEIAEHFGVYVKSAADAVHALAKKGYLRCGPEHRSIVLIK